MNTGALGEAGLLFLTSFSLCEYAAYAMSNLCGVYWIRTGGSWSTEEWLGCMVYTKYTTNAEYARHAN